jgi:ectoine hydroxylase-related dioxygenase (phytanoyl-CoA dioxygenase family)
MRVVKCILGEDCIVINKSLVVSSPGALDQAWHSDGPHISATEDLPCHCLNVFVPLVNVTEQNGPTQFRPGSVNMTRNLKVEMLKAMARKTLRPIEGPTLSMGSVLLFDYRVLHRGTANRTAQPRPVLVYTFAKPFYRDTLNFPRNSVFDVAPTRANAEASLEC